MEFTLQLLLGFVAAICLSGGLNLLIKGSSSFLPDSVPPQKTLDNLFRFLSGIYIGMGILLIWVVFNIQEQNTILYFLGLIVLFSGLGRLYSTLKVGLGGTYLTFVMLLEIVLGISIMTLQYFR
ncbi:MAG: DUF4345 domain-containing protein [Ginsengibacter sp.]|jgi:hypothetical protein